MPLRFAECALLSCDGLWERLGIDVRKYPAFCVGLLLKVLRDAAKNTHAVALLRHLNVVGADVGNFDGGDGRDAY